MHVHKAIHTSSEFCNQQSNDLKFSTLTQTKQNLEQSQRIETALYFPTKDGFDWCEHTLQNALQ